MSECVALTRFSLSGRARRSYARVWVLKAVNHANIGLCADLILSQIMRKGGIPTLHKKVTFLLCVDNISARYFCPSLT